MIPVGGLPSVVACEIDGIMAVNGACPHHGGDNCLVRYDRANRELTNRILWNERDGEIDEIVLHNVTVHIEQMADDCWWIGITRGGAEWAGNFYVVKGRKMTFREQENFGMVWDKDDAHADNERWLDPDVAVDVES